MPDIQLPCHHLCMTPSPYICPGKSPVGETSSYPVIIFVFFCLLCFTVVFCTLCACRIELELCIFLVFCMCFLCIPVHSFSRLGATMSIKFTTLFVRGFVLFIIGAIFALVLNLLQVQRQITLFPGVLDNVFSSAWWVPPSCGTAAGMIGL